MNNFIRKNICIFLIFSLSACYAPDRKFKSKLDFRSPSIFIVSLPNNSQISGSGSDGIFKKSSFEFLDSNFPIKNFPEKVFEEYLKNTTSDSNIDWSDSSTFEEAINKIEQQKNNRFDYYLFLTPNYPTKESDPFDGGFPCYNAGCLIIVPILLGMASYYGINKLYNLSINEESNSVGKNSKNLQFKIVYYPYKDRHRFQCLASFGMALVKHNKRQFAAHKSINYAKEIYIDDINYKTFSSFNNFSSEQKSIIEQACLGSLRQGIYRGLDEMGLLEK